MGPGVVGVAKPLQVVGSQAPQTSSNSVPATMRQASISFSPVAIKKSILCRQVKSPAAWLRAADPQLGHPQRVTGITLPPLFGGPETAPPFGVGAGTAPPFEVGNVKMAPSVGAGVAGADTTFGAGVAGPSLPPASQRSGSHGAHSSANSVPATSLQASTSGVPMPITKTILSPQVKPPARVSPCCFSAIETSTVKRYSTGSSCWRRGSWRQGSWGWGGLSRSRGWSSCGWNGCYRWISVRISNGSYSWYWSRCWSCWRRSVSI